MPLKSGYSRKVKNCTEISNESSSGKAISVWKSANFRMEIWISGVLGERTPNKVRFALQNAYLAGGVLIKVRVIFGENLEQQN